MAQRSGFANWILNDNHQHRMAENLMFGSDFPPHGGATFGSVNLRAIKRYVLLPMEWMTITGFLMLFLNAGKDTSGFVSGLSLLAAPLLIFCAVLIAITAVLSLFTWISTGSTEC